MFCTLPFSLIVDIRIRFETRLDREFGIFRLYRIAIDRCRDFQKLADRSYVSEKPNFSLALQRVFLAVLMGNLDSTQDPDVGDTVYTGDRLLGSEFSSATEMHIR
jgi:hypothetical protein